MKVRTRRMLLIFATAISLGGCAAMRRHDARDTGESPGSRRVQDEAGRLAGASPAAPAMPPLKIVSQSKDGHIVYRYADPYSCDCLYVGDQQAYAKYRSLALQEQRAAERLEAEEAEESASMDWDLWGPRL